MTSASDKNLRVFCAVELSAEVRELVGDYIAKLREMFPNVRASWERPEKLHLTLKFFGDIKPARVDQLAGAAERAAARVSPFPIKLSGAGAFPPKGPARVLWLGVVDESGGLASLQRHIEDECSTEGFPREARPYSPHLTLARMRTPAGVRPLAEFHNASSFESEPFTVSEFVVMRSELLPTGSRHTPLSHHPLSQP